MKVVPSICIASSLFLLSVALPAFGQNGGADIDKVRSLYIAAAYEEALAAMPADASGTAPRELEQYRALCLLALGREHEAVSAIERLVRANPTYRPSETETSPKMRSMFADVRSKLVPEVAREIYVAAKQAFDAKNLEGAKSAFARTIEIIDSLPDSDKETLADLRVVASGFVDLLAAQPVPKPEPPAPQPAAVEAPLEYVAPLPVREQLPAWNPPDTTAKLREYNGLLRIDIGADGRVVNASMVESTHPLYDAAAVRAAKTWTYKPATRGGRPVASQKDIRVRLVPQ